MSRGFKTILMFLFTLAVSSQDIQEEIISMKFKNQDSLNITIVYREAVGCLGLFVGKIRIRTNKDKLKFSHITNSAYLKSEFFSGTNCNIIDLILALESKSKKNHPICYGIDGDHCYFVDLTINGSTTKFEYKVNGEDNWNGLKELILKI